MGYRSVKRRSVKRRNTRKRGGSTPKLKTLNHISLGQCL